MWAPQTFHHHWHSSILGEWTVFLCIHWCWFSLSLYTGYSSLLKLWQSEHLLLNATLNTFQISHLTWHCPSIQLVSMTGPALTIAPQPEGTKISQAFREFPEYHLVATAAAYEMWVSVFHYKMPEDRLAHLSQSPVKLCSNVDFALVFVKWSHYTVFEKFINILKHIP